MAGPELPVTVSSTYADSTTDPTIGLHQRHHDVVHTLLNQFDTSVVSASRGDVPVSNGDVFVPRPLLATDIPAVVARSHSASYTLVPGDAGTTVELNLPGAHTLTVPADAAVAFAVGTVVAVRQYGAGTTTIRGASGVAIRSRGGCVALAGRYAEATLTKRAANEWMLVGDVA